VRYLKRSIKQTEEAVVDSGWWMEKKQARGDRLWAIG
jgi:hypothetical protein